MTMEMAGPATWRGYSEAARDRRWGAVRANAAAAGLDCLLVPLALDNLSFRPVLDEPSATGADGRYLTQLDGAVVVLPTSDTVAPIVITERPSRNSWLAETRTSGRGWLEPTFQALQEAGMDHATIGVVGLGSGAYTHANARDGVVVHSAYADLVARLPDATFRDATDVLGKARFLKSEEEIASLRQSCEIATTGVETLVKEARPEWFPNPQRVAGPWGPAMADALRAAGLERGRIGVTGLRGGRIGYARMPDGVVNHTAFAETQRLLPNATFVDVTDPVMTVRSVKSDEELDCMRRTVAIAEAGFDHLVELARPGLDANVLYGAVMARMLELGTEYYNTLGMTIDPIGARAPIATSTRQFRTGWSRTTSSRPKQTRSTAVRPLRSSSLSSWARSRTSTSRTSRCSASCSRGAWSSSSQATRSARSSTTSSGSVRAAA